MADLGSLVLQIKADISDLERNLNKASGNTKTFGDDLMKMGAAAATSLLAVASASVAMVQAAGRQAEALEQVSQKTGISVATIQNWTVAMAQSGLGTDTLTRGVKQLSEQIVNARTPNSQAAETFNELGITAHSVDGVLEQLADRFDMMPDGADKTRIAVDLFGKAGQDLIPILNKGAAGFRESMDASKSLGAVLSTDTVKALSAVDDSFDTLGVATRAAANQFAGLMAPAVGVVTDALARGTGVVATFFGALNEGSKGGENTIQFLKTLNPLIQKLGGPGFNVEAMEKQQKDLEAAGEASKQLHEEMIAKLEEEGRIQEDMGKRILVDLLAKWREITAERKSQEQLGRNINAIEQQASKERNADFARQIQQQEDVNNLQFKPATLSEAMKNQELAVENLIRLMPELNHQEAAFLALKNAEDAHNTIRDSVDAYKDRNKELELGVAYARADFQLQQSWYQQAPGLIDATNHVRMQGFAMIEAEGQLQRQLIDQNIFDEDRKAAALLALDMDTMAKRRQIIQQFPTFWEQQLQAIVASNAFSLSSITSSFNQATAQWIQGKGTFDEFLQQSQTTMLTSALQFTEQWLAQLALGQLRELGLIEAQEAAKTALRTSGDAARVASNAAADAELVSSNTVAATASTGIWGAATSAIVGFYATVESGFVAITASLVTAVIAVGEFIMGVLSAIAEALTSTVFGIPWAGAIVVGIGLIAAALAVTDNLPGFKDGGIMTGPTLAQFAEGGSAEAAIPLNDRGASFMQKTMGLGGGNGQQTIIVQIDKRTIARAVFDGMPAVVYARTGLA